MQVYLCVFDKESGFLNKGNVADLISLNFSKASDMVTKKKLLMNLDKVGISKGTERWVKI